MILLCQQIKTWRNWIWIGVLGKHKNYEVLKNLKKDLNVFEKIEVSIHKKLIIKIYRRGLIDQFNYDNLQQREFSR